jgi:sugar phosphate isomerase/epimerase
MATKNSNFASSNIPELSLSLWSIRYRMARQPNETLSLIEMWGISAVEVAGFFNSEAKKLQQELASHHLRTCSLIAPPIKTGRDFLFYQEWINKYLEIFQTKIIVMQSLQENFLVKNTSEHTKNCDAISELLIRIAHDLKKSGILVSYHCFPHDFQLVNNQSLISKLFALDTPSNLGLQLDTYWLNAGNVSPSNYSELPVHSAHLNERDAQGRNCVLGTDKNKCIKYIKPLVEREPSINWILENDSSDNMSKNNDGDMIETIRQCFVSWPKFWDSLKSTDMQPEKSDQAIAPIDTSQAPLEDLVLASDLIHYSSIPDSEIFEAELNDTLTEFILGDDANLEAIKTDYPKLKCYVNKRESQLGGYHDENYYAENRLFPLFWPSERPGTQVIHLVGGAGAGKSTFTRFFFRYFLPNYETLVNNVNLNSDLAKVHINAFHQHLLLYVDLRREKDSVEMESYIYNKLGTALSHLANQHGFVVDPKDGERYSEVWLKKQISQLSKEVEGNNRKWYISWILDNSDQLGNSKQSDLIKLLFEWIPEEPANSPSNTPVLEGQHRELWRVIIPIRPETLDGLALELNPLRNRQILELDPIDHDLLINKRAEYLSQKISDSTKNPFVDIVSPSSRSVDELNPRPQFNMLVPSEKALEMQESLRVAYGGQSESESIPDSAKPIFDKLVNGSARRRLYLVRKVAFSPAFHERLQKKKLSPFFFFEGLILGNKKTFQSNEPENLVMNLYCMGDDPKDNPYSIFVGIHSIFLLRQERQWEDVKNDLKKIGYPEQHLLQCEIHLEGKEIIKRVGGKWRKETPIIEGHWALIQERAYTDNMAVACAIAWRTPNMVTPTDPLYPETLLLRVKSSFWFLKKIWEAEQTLAYYPSVPEPQESCGEFSYFSAARKALKLPSITHRVASEYLDKIKKIPFYPRTKLAIDKEKESWDTNIEALKNLVEESAKPSALEARRS